MGTLNGRTAVLLGCLNIAVLALASAVPADPSQCVKDANAKYKNAANELLRQLSARRLNRVLFPRNSKAQTITRPVTFRVYPGQGPVNVKFGPALKNSL